MRPGEEIAAGPWQGAAAGQDGREVSARSRGRPGATVCTCERLDELLRLLEASIASRDAERAGMEARRLAVRGRARA